MISDLWEEIFPHLKNIIFNGIQMADDIEKARNALYRKDYEFIRSEIEEVDFKNWTHLLSRRFDVNYNDYRFSCLFNKREKGPLYVILNGALIGNAPEFKRWTYYKYLDGSMLNIADPMYYKFDNLKLGWYYGDENNNLRLYLADIILKAASILGIPNNQIVLIGSSAGGAAAIQVAHFIDGSTVIAINSQIKLSLYYYHERFKEITGIDLRKYDVFGRNDTSNILCDQSSNSKYILLENVRSKVDCDQILHIIPILDKKPEYGISQYKNLLIWIYEATKGKKDEAHGTQEYHEILYFILFLVKLFQNDETAAYSSMYRLLSEFWSDHFKRMNDNILFRINEKRKIKYLNLGRKPGGTHVLQAKDIKYEAGQKEKYKSIDVYKRLRVNTVYYLHLAGVEVIHETKEKFSILLRDLNQDTVYCRKDYSSDSDINYWFLTGEDAEEIYLRIYVGQPAHTENCKLIINELELLEFYET